MLNTNSLRLVVSVETGSMHRAVEVRELPHVRGAALVSVEVITLVPDVEPLLLPMEARLVLVKVVEVDEAMGPVALGTTVVAVHLAAADALPA